ncbi:hypothetical protein BpHYR1_017360 [Brachionus plicatilis]|uniref:Uncharacterized protein n=1 Tax=Brachionus plicatilis TaxID=10195 RepID=A0A3M7QUL0_BRAPC|nr:hypothetical protein BpHYR1_017360 [Brachionus plicatilis]
MIKSDLGKSHQLKVKSSQVKSKNFETLSKQRTKESLLLTLPWPVPSPDEKRGGVMMTQAHRGRDEEACKLELMIVCWVQVP